MKNQTSEINTFQMKIPDETNRKIKSLAAENGLTKHDWINRAIKEKLQRDNEAV
jgi:predicted transcriptional regulator